jgi:hypothetical protein
VGTVADEKGYFSLRVPNTFTRDSLTVSAIGYQKQVFSIAYLTAKQQHTFFLPAKATALQEVVVRA